MTLSGKINNKYDAEKVYTKIIEDKTLLRSYKNFSRNKNAQSIAKIISNLGYAVFGPLLPPKDNSDDIENVDIRDMPGLESEENAAKTLATIKKYQKQVTKKNQKMQKQDMD